MIIKDTITVLSNTPKLLRLVWQASHAYTILMGFITIIDGIMPVCQMWIGKLIVDNVVYAVKSQVPTDELRKLFVLVALGLTLVLAENLLQRLRGFMEETMNEILSDHSNNLLMSKSIELDLAYYETPSFYDKLRIAQAHGGDQSIWTLQSMFDLITYLINISSMLVLFAKLNWFIMLAVVFTSLPNFIVRLRASREKYVLHTYQTPEGRKSGYFTDLLTGNDYAKEVKLFELGNYLIEKWKNIYERFCRENKSLALKEGVDTFLADLSSKACYYACYAYVLYKAVLQDITIGDMTMYAQAISQSQSFMDGIFFRISEIYKVALNVSTFFDFLKLKSKVVNIADPKPFPDSIRKGIDFCNVSFKYPETSNDVLQNLDFTVKPGESIALVGENGAGKTTLIKLLARLYDPTEGNISIDGINLKDFGLSGLRSNIGVIFQDYAQYLVSVRQNIGFGNVDKIDDLTKIIESAKKSGADEFIDQLPQKYETTLGKLFDDGVELSGGQWQKIALARAFLRDSQILILDEPTASLDAKTEYEVFKRFRELTKGRITFLISHRFSTVRMADRIIVIENGRIIENGSHVELMRLNGIYARMFNMQAEGYREKAHLTRYSYRKETIINQGVRHEARVYNAVNRID